VGVNGQQLHILEFVSGEFFDVFPRGTGSHFACVGARGSDKRDFKDFRLHETAGGVAQNSPGDVCDAIFGLVVQLCGGTAHLHGMEHLHLDLAARLFFDLLRPRNDGLGRNGGLRRQELVQTQSDLLSHGTASDQRGTHQTDSVELELFHGEVSLGMTKNRC